MRPESYIFCRKALPLLYCESILNKPVSIHCLSDNVLHFRFDLHLSMRLSKGSINFANTVFDVGIFEVIKIFSDPTQVSSAKSLFFKNYFISFFTTINLPPH